MTLQCQGVVLPTHATCGATLCWSKIRPAPSVAALELTEFDGETNETNALIVKAPIEPGEHTWLAVCPAVVKDGVAYAEASSPISFTVKPHTNVCRRVGHTIGDRGWRTFQD